MTRVGLLTGGGDCPGLNAVIRAVVRRGLAYGDHSFVGFRYGWAGVLEDDAFELTRERTAGILPRGGTILGTSRTNPYADGRDGTAAIRATLKARGVDAPSAVTSQAGSGDPERLLVDGSLRTADAAKKAAAGAAAACARAATSGRVGGAGAGRGSGHLA